MVKAYIQTNELKDPGHRAGIFTCQLSNPLPDRRLLSGDHPNKLKDLLLLTARELTDLLQCLHNLRLWRRCGFGILWGQHQPTGHHANLQRCTGCKPRIFQPVAFKCGCCGCSLTALGKVACNAQRYLGVIHGFFQLGGISPTARNLMRDLAWRVSSLDKP